MSKSTRRLKIRALLLPSAVLLSAAYLLWEESSYFLNYNHTGNNIFGSDFSIIWSAFKAFQKGANCYDPQTISTIQEQNRLFSQNIFYYPPFIFTLAYPFSIFSLPTAVKLWFLMNAALSGILYLQTKKLFSLGHSLKTAFLFAFFVPLLTSLILGQTTILATTFVYGAYLLYLKGSAFRAGFLLGLAFIKPQLWWLVFLPFLLKAGKAKRLRLFAGVAFSLSLLILPISLKRPLVWSEFITAASTLSRWEALTLYTLWRKFTVGFNAKAQLLSFYALTLFPLFLSLKESLLNNREALKMESFFLLLILSPLLSPYAWISDYISAVGAVFALFCLPSGKSPLIESVYLIAASVSLFQAIFYNADFRILWFPLLLFCLYCLRVKRL